MDKATIVEEYEKKTKIVFENCIKQKSDEAYVHQGGKTILSYFDYFKNLPYYRFTTLGIYGNLPRNQPTVIGTFLGLLERELGLSILLSPNVNTNWKRPRVSPGIHTKPYLLYLDQPTLIMPDTYYKVMPNETEELFKSMATFNTYYLGSLMNVSTDYEAIERAVDKAWKIEKYIADKVLVGAEEKRKYERAYNIYTTQSANDKFTFLNFESYLEQAVAGTKADSLAKEKDFEFNINEVQALRVLNNYLKTLSYDDLMNYINFRIVIAVDKLFPRQCLQNNDKTDIFDLNNNNMSLLNEKLCQKAQIQSEMAAFANTRPGFQIGLPRHPLPFPFPEPTPKISTQADGQYDFACAYSTAFKLSSATTRIYIDQVLPTKEKRREVKSKVALLVNNVIDGFQYQLDRLDWMSTETKKNAYEKINYLVKNIVYPEWVEDNNKLNAIYKELDVDESQSYAEFTAAMNSFSRQQDYDLLVSESSVERDDFLMSMAIVNAWYQPEVNSITIPYGILQAPFFHPDYPAAANLGAIGVIAGHELTHGFDDEGVQYDGVGALRTWMDSESKKSFESMAKCVIDQYSGFEPYPGLHLDGSNTQGENIADNGGLRAAFNALASYESFYGPDPSLPDSKFGGFTNQQLFFLSYARAWCEIPPSKEDIQKKILLDPHSPSKYRVIGGIQNFPAFRDAFNCPAKTEYAPESHCNVWASEVNDKEGVPEVPEAVVDVKIQPLKPNATESYNKVAKVLESTMNLDKAPCDDFYGYTCQAKNTVDKLAEAEDVVDEAVWTYLKSKKFDEKTDLTVAYQFLENCENDQDNGRSVDTAIREIETILNVEVNFTENSGLSVPTAKWAELGHFLAYKYDLDLFFRLSVRPNLKKEENTKPYRFYFEQPDLFLKPEIYNSNWESAIFTDLYGYVGTVAKSVFGVDSTSMRNVIKALQVEYSLVSGLYKNNDITVDRHELYTVGEIINEYQNLELLNYLNNAASNEGTFVDGFLGFFNNYRTQVVNSAPKYLKSIDEYLGTIDSYATRDLVNYVALRVMMKLHRFVPGEEPKISENLRKSLADELTVPAVLTSTTNLMDTKITKPEEVTKDARKPLTKSSKRCLKELHHFLPAQYTTAATIGLYGTEENAVKQQRDIAKIADHVFEEFEKQLDSIAWMPLATRQAAVNKVRGVARNYGIPTAFSPTDKVYQGQSDAKLDQQMLKQMVIENNQKSAKVDEHGAVKTALNVSSTNYLAKKKALSLAYTVLNNDWLTVEEVTQKNQKNLLRGIKDAMGNVIKSPPQEVPIDVVLIRSADATKTSDTVAKPQVRSEAQKVSSSSSTERRRYILEWVEANAVKKVSMYQNLLDTTKAQRDLFITYDQRQSTPAAAHNHDLNSISLSLATFQAPFYDKNYPMAWNFATVGTLVAEQLAKLFDSTGLQHDELGQLNEWMDVPSQDIVKITLDKLTKQYIDVKLDVVSESKALASTLGVKLAYQGLVSWNEYNGEQSALIHRLFKHYNSEQLFFIVYSQQHCNSINILQKTSSAPEEPNVDQTVPLVYSLVNGGNFQHVFSCPAKARYNPGSRIAVYESGVDGFVGVPNLPQHESDLNIEKPVVSYSEKFQECAEAFEDSVDTTADPCSDFYQYTCGNYHASSSFADADIGNQIRLINGIRDIDKEDRPVVQLEKMLFQQCKQGLPKFDELNSDGKVLKTIVNDLEQFIGQKFPLANGNQMAQPLTPAQIGKALGYLSGAQGIGALVDTMVYSNVRAPEKGYSIYIDVGYYQLADFLDFPDDLVIHVISYHIQRYLNATMKVDDELVAKILEEAKAFIEIEKTLIASSNPSDIDNRNASQRYTHITLKELIQDYPKSIDFRSFMEGMVAEVPEAKAKVTDDNFDVGLFDPQDFESFWNAFDKLIKGGGLKPQNLLNYLFYRVIVQRKGQFLPLPKGPLAAANIKSTKGVYENLKWERKLPKIDGIKYPESDIPLEDTVQGKANAVTQLEASCLDLLSGYMQEATNAMYVDVTYPDKEKRTQDRLGVARFADSIMVGFRTMLDQLAWMRPESKETAYKKIDLLVKNIAYPNMSVDDTELEKYHKELLNSDLTEGNIAWTIFALIKFNMKKAVSELTRDVYDRATFGKAYRLNAWYQPAANSITLPGSILQQPFYDAEWPDAVNFGSIGAVAGHELVHGFDDGGVQWDPVGRLHSWIDEKSFNSFKEMAQCVIDEYDGFCYPDGACVDGRNTQGENIADNGGIQAAYRAYRNQVGVAGPDAGLPSHLIGRFTFDQLFFLSFGRTWCNAPMSKERRKQLLADVHSPPEFRVFGTLQNFPAFRDAFNCPAQTAYAPKEHCKVWISDIEGSLAVPTPIPPKKKAARAHFKDIRLNSTAIRA